LNSSIVLPFYNGYQMTHSLLLDIYKCFPPEVEIIAVDDCSTSPEVQDGMEWWASGLLKGRLKIVTNDRNYGFLKTANYGITQASGDIVMLISNDVRISDYMVLNKVVCALNKAAVPTLVIVYLMWTQDGTPSTELLTLIWKDGSWLSRSLSGCHLVDLMRDTFPSILRILT
jgi:glycosyltransferase involved in cell wall biosynthesis